MFFPGQHADDEDDGFDQGHTDTSRPQSEQDHETDSGSTGSRRNSVSLGRHSDETISSQGTGSTGNTSPRPLDGLPIANGYFSPKSQKSNKGSRETLDPELHKNDNASSSSSDTARNKAHNRSATVFQLPRAPTTKLQKSPSVVNIRDRRQATKESEVTPPLPTLRIQPQHSAYGTSGFHLPTGGSRSQAQRNAQNDWQIMAPGSTISAADSHAVGRPMANNRHSTAFGLNDFIPPTTTPFIHRSLPKAPSNPRDHALLEYIYAEMCGARFINLAPLSLLGNLVVLHFKGASFTPLYVQSWTTPQMCALIRPFNSHSLPCH